MIFKIRDGYETLNSIPADSVVQVNGIMYNYHGGTKVRRRETWEEIEVGLDWECKYVCPIIEFNSISEIA